MNAVDQLSNKYYLDHLTQVNTKMPVVLCEDVLNERGVLVVRKGLSFDAELCDKILKHRLAKPIDLSIMIADALDAKDVLSLYLKSMQHLGVIDVAKNGESLKSVAGSFKNMTRYPMLMQKISVFEQQFPEVFSRNICSSSLILGLASELHLSKQATENTFMANMLCEIGLLHIDPDVASLADQCSWYEHKTGMDYLEKAKFFASQLPSLPEAVITILSELYQHAKAHEAFSKVQVNEPSTESQILIAVERVSTLANLLVRQRQYSWRSLEYVMQLPVPGLSSDVHNALRRLLKRLQLPFSPAYSATKYSELASHASTNMDSLNAWFDELMVAISVHSDALQLNRREVLQEAIESLARTATTSGVFNELHHQWLRSLQSAPSLNDIESVEEYTIILNEMARRTYALTTRLTQISPSFSQLFKAMSPTVSHIIQH